MNTIKSHKTLKLNRKHWLAIQLRYEGKKYEEIAKRTGFSLNTINDYFKQDGKLFSDYEQYEEEQNEIRKKEASRIIRYNLNKAMKVLIDLLDSNDTNIRFKVAKEIIDRELGKAVIKQEIKDPKNDRITTALVQFIDSETEKDKKEWEEIQNDPVKKAQYEKEQKETRMKAMR